MDQEFPFDHFLKQKKPFAELQAIEIRENNNPISESKSKEDNNLNDLDSSSNDELEALNAAILKEIKSQIGLNKFGAYFENTFKLAELGQEKLSFQVTTAFIKTMIERHYQNNLEKSVENILGKRIKIELTISNDTSPKLSSNKSNILNSLPKANQPSTVKEASFKLDLAPNKDDLINQIESKYMHHMDDKHIGINPSKTFENFIVGPSNHMAYSSAVAIAKSPGKAYPSTYIYSSSGLGKTHLLQAIANKIRELYPHLRICIITARDFMTEMINSLQSNKIIDFRKKYSEDVDVLMIDDIQELKNKQSTQNEFFHVFNELHNKGKQLIFTSDQDPKEIAGIEERIKTRLSWGLVSDIQQPDIETRIAILKQKTQEEDIFLPDDVINLIACAYQHNIRELEGSLIRLGAYASLFGVDIDIEIAKEQLKLNLAVDPKTISIDAVAKCTSQYFKIPVADLRSKARYKEVTLARHIAMYISYKKVKTTYEELGSFFGKRDHTSVLHAVEKITQKLKTDAFLSQAILEIENLLS